MYHIGSKIIVSSCVFKDTPKRRELIGETGIIHEVMLFPSLDPLYKVKLESNKHSRYFYFDGNELTVISNDSDEEDIYDNNSIDELFSQLVGGS